MAVQHATAKKAPPQLPFEIIFDITDIVLSSAFNDYNSASPYHVTAFGLASIHPAVAHHVSSVISRHIKKRGCEISHIMAAQWEHRRCCFIASQECPRCEWFHCRLNKKERDAAVKKAQDVEYAAYLIKRMLGVDAGDTCEMEID